MGVTWTEERAERLRDAVSRAGSQEEIAKRAGISRTTLNSMFRADADFRLSTLESVCAAAGTTIEQILSGSGQLTIAPAGEMVSIPIVEVEASAGPGRTGSARPAIVDSLPMPRSIAQRAGGPDGLQLVIVRGDSGAPEINDGDLVLMNVKEPYRGEGLYVLVLDGDLAVKRLQRKRDGLLVLSRNPDYPAIEIPADEVDDRVRVLGRVRWAGRTY